MTPRERAEAAAWAKRLERVLLRAPRGVALVTCGDRGLTVIDAEAAGGADLHDGGTAAYEIATASSACIVHGVSG